MREWELSSQSQLEEVALLIKGLTSAGRLVDQLASELTQTCQSIHKLGNVSFHSLTIRGRCWSIPSSRGHGALQEVLRFSERLLELGMDLTLLKLLDLHLESRDHSLLLSQHLVPHLNLRSSSCHTDFQRIAFGAESRDILTLDSQPTRLVISFLCHLTVGVRESRELLGELVEHLLRFMKPIQLLSLELYLLRQNRDLTREGSHLVLLCLMQQMELCGPCFMFTKLFRMSLQDTLLELLQLLVALVSGAFIFQDL
jgi:hypothetical protein